MAKKLYFLTMLSEFFVAYLPGTKGLSGNTIRSYKQAFRLLLKYIYITQKRRPEKVELCHLERGVIEGWLNWLCTERGCSAKTRNHRLAALVAFSRFAMQRDFPDTVVFCAEIERLPKLKVPKNTESVYLTKEEMGILLHLPGSQSRTERRNKVILSSLYASGARAQELCDLTVGNVRFAKETTLTLFGKGGKARTIVIPSQCARLLRLHMEDNSLSETDTQHHMFSSQTHEHMSISCVEEIVKKYVKEAKQLHPGLFQNHYTPHSFRHSIAMHMLESGIPLPVIKTFLGHASIASTMVYASANYELVKKYLKDKDPYAMDDVSLEELDIPSVPAFLK